MYIAFIPREISLTPSIMEYKKGFICFGYILLVLFQYITNIDKVKYVLNQGIMFGIVIIRLLTVATLPAAKFLKTNPH